MLWTLPPQALPLGFWSEAHEHLPCAGVEFANPGSSPMGVEVLADTVSVAGGTLRGLVRNWSSTLWAWGAEVHVEGRSFAWPLTIQPGEVAGFEFANWDGPADLGSIEFSVTAQMSDEADLSRGFKIARSLSYGICREDLAGHGGILAIPDEQRDEILLGAGCLAKLGASGQYRGRLGPSGAHTGLGGVSHPSMRGEMAPGLVAELRAYGAAIDDNGVVVDLQRLTLFVPGGYSENPEGPDMLRDENGNLLVSPAIVIREYPTLDRAYDVLTVLIPSRWAAEFVVWIGGAN